MLGAFVFVEHFAGADHDLRGQAGQLGDLDSVAAVGSAGLYLTQKDDAAGVLFDGDMEVLDACQALQFCEFVVMGGEQGLGAAGRVDVFNNGPGNGQTIVGRSATAISSSRINERDVAVFKI